MSGAPSPGPLYRECGAPKTTRTEELTYSSTRTDSETMRETTGKTSVTTTAICPTPGCPQRKRDRWELRRWQLDTDPALADTPETREWEIQEIVTDERRYTMEMDVLLSSGTPEQDRDRRERTTRGEQAPQRPDERHEREQPPRRDTETAGEPSDGERSHSTPTGSRAWGDTDGGGTPRGGAIDGTPTRTKRRDRTPQRSKTWRGNCSVRTLHRVRTPTPVPRSGLRGSRIDPRYDPVVAKATDRGVARAFTPWRNSRRAWRRGRPCPTADRTPRWRV